MGLRGELHEGVDLYSPVRHCFGLERLEKRLHLGGLIDEHVVKHSELMHIVMLGDEVVALLHAPHLNHHVARNSPIWRAWLFSLRAAPKAKLLLHKAHLLL